MHRDECASGGVAGELDHVHGAFQRNVAGGDFFPALAVVAGEVYPPIVTSRPEFTCGLSRFFKGKNGGIQLYSSVVMLDWTTGDILKFVLVGG